MKYKNYSSHSNHRIFNVRMNDNLIFISIPQTMTVAGKVFELDDLILAQSIILIFVAIFAVCTCVLVITVILRLVLLHRNVRFLLINAFSAAILNTVAQSAVASYNIAYYFYPADVRLNKLQCFFLTSMLVPSYRLFMEFLGVLTLERCLSRIFRNHKSRSLILTLILAAGLYSLNGYFVVKSLTNVLKVANQSLEFCNSFFTVDSYSQSFDICVYTIVQVGVAILFCLIYRLSKRQYASNLTINTARHNLHDRFANWSNIKTMAELLPFLIYQTFLAALVNLCSIILLATNWTRNLDQKTVRILMFMNLTRTSNFFLSTLIWMLKHEKMSAKLREMGICRFRKKMIKVNAERESKGVVPFHMGADLSNNVLNNIWATKKLPTKRNA